MRDQLATVAATLCWCGLMPRTRLKAALSAKGPSYPTGKRLFDEVLDGRSARLVDGVRRALGREPRDFSGYARDAAATGVWNPGAIRAA